MAPIRRNEQDAAAQNYKHHCGLCGGAPSQQCFRKTHVAYCEACGSIFTVKSSKSGGGCISHPYSRGYNLSYKKIRQNLPADHRSKYDLEIEAEARKEMELEAAQRKQAAEERAAAKEQEQTKKEKKDLRVAQKRSRYRK